ncbi:MAG: hypothetical protein COT43_04810 [Candidatus Marinimicrobia bacterium CG08_land_8_20_14_0_20_45_22]|nr:MAG: hypothetical protein COT43_04810 [Candidatus Marinimicrobia bacterium CG08_land_8_20_14_0_20_45_22]
MKQWYLVFLAGFLIESIDGKELVTDDRKNESTSRFIVIEDKLAPNLPAYQKPGVHFLPSYRDKKGFHLLIDSLNIVVPVGEDDLRDMTDFIASFDKTGNPVDFSSDRASSAEKVRYYATNLTADQLMTQSVEPKDIVGKSHFKGMFDTAGNLQSLEFIPGRTSPLLVGRNFKYSYVFQFDLLFNKYFHFTTPDGRKPIPRAKMVRDEFGQIRYVDYLINGKNPIARGKFTYGANGTILEQRIDFPEGGKLTDLNPYYFDLQFNMVKPGWVIKCLYSSDNRLERLIVMDDSGNQYYHYQFVFQKSETDAYAARGTVYDDAKEMYSSYEMYFDKFRLITRKVTFGKDEKFVGSQTFFFDGENLKIGIDSFDAEGKNLGRMYQQL